jgi:hypothetical protein
MKRVGSRLAGSALSVYPLGFPNNRGIAQPGSAAVLGTAGRWFESSCPDQNRWSVPKVNTAEQGDTANIKQNTTNAGFFNLNMWVPLFSNHK